MKTKLFIIVLIVCSAMLSCRPKPIPGPEGDDGNGEDYIYGPGNITGIYDPDRRVDIIILKSEGEEIEFNEWNWSEGRLQLISSEHYSEEYYYGEDGRIEKKVCGTNGSKKTSCFWSVPSKISKTSLQALSMLSTVRKLSGKVMSTPPCSLIA